MQKNVIFLFGLVLGFFFVTGCSHFHPVQGIEQKTESSPDGVRVAIGSGEVKEGDTVEVIKYSCISEKNLRGTKTDVCKIRTLGEAHVVKVLDKDFSIVAPEQGLLMDSSMKVEKKLTQK